MRNAEAPGRLSVPSGRFRSFDRVCGLLPYSLPSQQYVQIFLGSMPMASIMPCSDW